MTTHDPADATLPTTYPALALPVSVQCDHDGPANSSSAARTAARTDEGTLGRLLDPAVPLPDPDDPTNAEAYTRLAAEVRGAQTAVEWARTHTLATAWAARMSAWARARRVSAAVTAADDHARRDHTTPGLRAPFRTVAGLPPRFDVGTGARGLRVAEACARRLCARQGAMAPALDVGVAAGAGRELWDAPVPSWVSLPADLPDGRYFAVPVDGDSMEPLLSDGDLLLVRVDVAPVTGTVVVARHPDDGYVVKRLAAVTADAFTLAPTNPRYSELTIPRDPALVAGRVVLAWRA